MSPRNKIPDCESRLMMECSGCRTSHRHPVIPTAGEVASAVIPPTAAMAKKPGSSRGWRSNGRHTGEMQGLPNIVMDVPDLLNPI